ncbi:MAG: nitroreductase/quinone reductase family protein [Nakamurella sp.]
MPNDFLLKSMNVAHRTIRAASGGHVGWTIGGMPVVELTTIGRKSGNPHTVMLTSPIKAGDAVVVVASRGGDDRHPAWFLNLTANPDVEVKLEGGDRVHMHAREATPAERTALWPQIVADHRNYAGYQAKTDREIPLVLLTATDA